MSFSVHITNATDSDLVVNSTTVPKGARRLFEEVTNLTLMTQYQGVLELTWSTTNSVSLRSAYYRNDVAYDNTSALQLVIDAEYGFSLEGTPIQGVPLQTNRVASFPFSPLADTPLPRPWKVGTGAPAVDTVTNQNSSELLFTNTTSGPFDTWATLQITPDWRQGLQISFKLAIEAYPMSTESSNEREGLHLPSGFYLRRNDAGVFEYWYKDSEATHYAGASHIKADGAVNDLIIVGTPNAYFVIENGACAVREAPSSDSSISFGAYFREEPNAAGDVRFTVADIEIGTPWSATNIPYAFSGMDTLWPQNVYLEAYYEYTNWVQCGGTIAAISHHSTDIDVNQKLVILDIKTGEVIEDKDSGHVSHPGDDGYRAPFVDEAMGLICFPIDNQYYSVYDINLGTFIDWNKSLTDGTIKYSEAICHKGVITFLRYDKNWVTYNVFSGEQKTTPCPGLDNDIKRIVKPIVYNDVVFAAMYTEGSKHHTELVAYQMAGITLTEKWTVTYNIHLRSDYITCDFRNIYYWNDERALVAIDRETGAVNWATENYAGRCYDVGFNFAPTTNGLGAIYIMTDDGEVMGLSAETGLTTGTTEKPFTGRTFTVGDTYLMDRTAIYPDDDHSFYDFRSRPAIVNGHLTYQAANYALISVNLDTGIIQKTTLDSGTYVSNFTANTMTYCLDLDVINMVQMQQYDKNFYFDAALMADEYERDPVTGDMRPVAVDNSFYTVTASVQDDQALPKNTVVTMKNMGEPVEVYSALFETEGGRVLLGTGERVAFTTGIDGKFKFKIRAESLYCPAMFFWSDFMLPSAEIAFFPNQSNVDVLRQQQAGDVSAAVDYRGEAVFEADYQNDTDQIVAMIGNCVGGGMGSPATPALQTRQKTKPVRSIAERARRREAKQREIKRRSRLKQDILETADYKPTLTMDYCAFADDSTDNCLCSNDPSAPIIDQAYLVDENRYVAGMFVVGGGELAGPEQGIVYDPDTDHTHWQEAQRAYQQQIETYLADIPAGEHAQAEAAYAGFPAFVQDVVKGTDKAHTYHWQPLADATQKGLGKAFKVIIRTAKKIYEFAVNTIEIGLQVLHAFFKIVAKSMQAVLQWLSWVLNWKDILICRENLEHAMINNLNKGKNHFVLHQQAWVDKVDQYVNAAQETIDTTINQAEEAVGGYSFEDVTQDYKNPRDALGEGGNNITNQSDYLNDQIGIPSTQAELRQLDRLLFKYQQSGKSRPNLALAPEQFHKDLRKAYQHSQIDTTATDFMAHNADLEKAFASLGATISEFLKKFVNQIGDEVADTIKTEFAAVLLAFRTKTNTPQQFLQTCQVTLLDLFRTFADLALEASRLLMTDIIQLIPQLIDGVLDLMTKPINIPGLNQLWTLIVGNDQPLTILGFTSLLLALPMTLTMRSLGLAGSVFFKEGGIPRDMSEQTWRQHEKDIYVGLACGCIFGCLFYGSLDTLLDTMESTQGVAPFSIPYMKQVQTVKGVLDLAIVGMTFPTYTADRTPFPLDYAIWGWSLFHSVVEPVFIGQPGGLAYSKIQPLWATTYASIFNLMVITSFAFKIPKAESGYDIADTIMWFEHAVIYSVPEMAKPLNWFPGNGQAALIALDIAFHLANSLFFIYPAVREATK